MTRFSVEQRVLIPCDLTLHFLEDDEHTDSIVEIEDYQSIRLLKAIAQWDAIQLELAEMLATARRRA